MRWHLYVFHTGILFMSDLFFPGYCINAVSESKAKAHTRKARLLKRLTEREPGGLVT